MQEDAKEKRLRIMEDAKSKAKGLEDKNVRELIKQYIWSKVRRRAEGAAERRGSGAAERRRSAHFSRSAGRRATARLHAAVSPCVRSASDPRA